MKSFLRAILKHIRFYLSPVYQQLQMTKGKRRILLLNTPLHGNLGDAAIVLAERKFLDERTELPWLEVTQEDLIYFDELIWGRIQPGDILALQGGGSIGTLWPLEQQVISNILSRFSQNKIVVFPQTMYFSADAEGEKIRVEFKEKAENCRDLTIFFRDARSYELAKTFLDETKLNFFLTPDIVTYFDPMPAAEKKDQILICFRSDLEGVVDEKIKDRIHGFAKSMGAQVMVTDTQVLKMLTIDGRGEDVQKKLLEFGQARLVITDRIHGMLFAAIAGTPCIALDNISKKVSGARTWINYLPYVQMATEESLSVDMMQTFYQFSDCRFDHEQLEKYYKTIAQTFAS